MFLTTEDLSIDGFLKAISFIPPAGMTVDYFISPEKVEGSENFFNVEQDPAATSDSITYNRKDPNTKIHQADTPAEYAENFSQKLVNTGNKMPVTPQSTPIESLGCPFIDVVSDTNLGTDILLKENFGPFKKNTVFHCIKESITCWEDFYDKGKKLGISQVEQINDLRDKIGKSFGHWNKDQLRELKEILESIPDSEYETYSFIQDMYDYFGFDDLFEGL